MRMPMTAAVPVFLGLAASLAGATTARAACGWAFPERDTLAFRSDARIDPRTSGPLPKPPAGAVAVWCERDSLVVEHPDFRVIWDLHLPYIVRHAGQFGVLQFPPGVVLNFHTDHGRFVPGRAPDPGEEKTRT